MGLQQGLEQPLHGGPSPPDPSEHGHTSPVPSGMGTLGALPSLCTASLPWTLCRSWPLRPGFVSLLASQGVLILTF